MIIDTVDRDKDTMDTVNKDKDILLEIKQSLPSVMICIVLSYDEQLMDNIWEEDLKPQLLKTNLVYLYNNMHKFNHPQLGVIDISDYCHRNRNELITNWLYKRSSRIEYRGKKYTVMFFQYKIKSTNGRPPQGGGTRRAKDALPAEPARPC